MLYSSIAFLLVAVLAGLLGFGVTAGAAAMIVQVLFIVFLVMFVLSLVQGRKPRI